MAHVCVTRAAQSFPRRRPMVGHTFTQTMVESNLSAQSVAVLANSLELNGARTRAIWPIHDAGPSHSGLNRNPVHRVEGMEK
ncbi:MAG: hypothetical protein OXG33_11525 [Chloroflexi bacterium]|nr:hypothetical protein [Chloroflexota bacterium]